MKQVNVRLTCLVCKKDFLHLGSHIWHKHKMLARDYKSRFSLPYKMGLISEQVKVKQRKANLKYRDQNRENLTSVGKKFRFKKGRTGQRRISIYERRRFVKQILAINKQRKKVVKTCPVCRIKFNNVHSHLYRAHKLISVRHLKLHGAYSLDKSIVTDYNVK